MKKIILLLILCMFLTSCVSSELSTNNEAPVKVQEQPKKNEEPVTSALEELKEKLEESQKKFETLDKVDECAKICAGENAVQAVIDQWYASCYEIYYYVGEEALDNQINDCS